MAQPTMVGFGHKQAWLAVAGDDPLAVCSALGARDLGPVAWRAGIDLSYFTDDRLAITPPLAGAGNRGWVLAVGRWLLRPGTDVDIVALSAGLGTEVQSFATHRVEELHRWSRAVDGVLVRGFGYHGAIGEVTHWWGEPDAAELAVGLPATLDEDAAVLVGEADVLRIAAAWSVDPTSIDGRPAPGPLRAAAT